MANNFIIQNFADDKLTEILTRLIPEFMPIKIYLFGSRSKGTNTADSDYDLFFILDHSDLSQIKRMQKASILLWGVGVKVDIFIYTKSEFEDWKTEFNSIPYTVSNEGLELLVG